MLTVKLGYLYETIAGDTVKVIAENCTTGEFTIRPISYQDYDYTVDSTGGSQPPFSRSLSREIGPCPMQDAPKSCPVPTEEPEEDQAQKFATGDIVKVTGTSPWKGLEAEVVGYSDLGNVQVFNDGAYLYVTPEKLELVEADMVNHPPHYNQGGIETIDGIEAALGAEGFIAYCRGNAMKYLWRAGAKGLDTVDFRKAEWYCRKAAEAAEAAEEGE